MDGILNSITQSIEEKNAQEKDGDQKYNFKFDALQMYYGMDYKVNDKISIHIPTIGELIEFGESRVFSAISPFTSNPTSYRLMLWDLGVDWNKVTDYELFAMLVKSMNVEDTSLLFGDVDFSKLDMCINTLTNEKTLVDYDQELIVDEATYMKMREYIRLAFNQYPKVEKAKGKSTKLAIIDEDRMNLALQKQKDNKNTSVYLPLISALLNHPGFKYKKSELIDVGMVEFMDSVQRLQIYESTRALMSGVYSGFCDTSKLNLNKELNWMRDLKD